MANYQEAVLNQLNQLGTYRLPELTVFQALEQFKIQCNQVLVYQGLSIQFRHLVRDPNNPKDDGGIVVLYNKKMGTMAELATWEYNHPFHTLPITFLFGSEKYVCHQVDDMEIALQAMVESDRFRQLIQAMSETGK